jgi:hypothetical protein
VEEAGEAGDSEVEVVSGAVLCTANDSAEAEAEAEAEVAAAAAEAEAEAEAEAVEAGGAGGVAPRNRARLKSLCV